MVAFESNREPATLSSAGASSNESSGDEWFDDALALRSKIGIASVQASSRIAIMSSLVPDEIIASFDHTVRIYEASLMFVDVSGFSDLCENYTLARGGPSRLTQILNCYIGAMVQEILTHHGDVIKFSGDAFIAMWKKTPRLTMQDVVHTAIDCGLIIQKNYGQLMTDVGILLKVKIAISAGVVHFAVIGAGGDSETRDSGASSYVVCGQPVWDVKMAEYLTAAGDVLTSPSAWMYVNEAEYCTQPCGDGRHTKVLGVGASWKRVEQIHSSLGVKESSYPSLNPRKTGHVLSLDINYREYSLRPAVITAMRSTVWPGLRRFMLAPILRAVDNDEPLDFLTEVRRVVVVFVNIVTATVTNPVLINIMDTVYSLVCSVTVSSGGLVNKVTIFDKDLMFLVVFGLRGLKHEDEAQKALQCAYTLKTSIQDANIISVSIGVTSGIAYCGLVGHVLRREYTVIGPTVNKAARLMMAYSNRVTCDKETFLRSKLDQDYFKLLEPRILKGIARPGPIYEFNKMSWPERQHYSRHPLLGRNEEVQQFKSVLQNALEQQYQKFTRYRDNQFGIAFIGPRLIGKTRLLEACLNSTPSDMKMVTITLSEDNKAPYEFFRHIVSKTFTGSRGRTYRDTIENRIRHVVDVTAASPTQIYAINAIFDCRFPLPEAFQYSEDILDNFNVRQIIQQICKNQYESMWLIAIEEAQYIDDESWRILLLVMDTKTIFVVMCITTDDVTNDLLPLSKIGNKCLANNMIVKIHLQGIDRWYHAALACQLLDVQAIPADLEKVIESASGGMPGWIQNFVISLVQRGLLTVVSVPRSEAVASGAVVPSSGLLQRAPAESARLDSQSRNMPSFQSIISAVSNMPNGDSVHNVQTEDVVQMAVLADGSNFGDITVDMAMDVIILQTYDSLTPFEKMLLKCASVLGDVFSRRMLLYLLQNDSGRIVAQAVAKLFEIRVLECEGGDFTQDTSYVMVHPAPAMPTTTPPYCACLGTRPPPNCRDLPMYAFCGYMKFRYSLFRTTTYELLTDNQKHEMHARVLIFLERFTRRCKSCGLGCFVKLLGFRIDSGLVDESPALKRTREQIRALSAETRVPGEIQSSSAFAYGSMTDFRGYNVADVLSSCDFMDTEGALLGRVLDSKSPLQSNQLYLKEKKVRSFSSLELENCECLTILQSFYCQVIDHCRGAAEYEKLYEAYLEYADINIMNLNIPQAVRLLFEVETFVTTHKYYTRDIRKDWVMDYQLARICSMRGICMLESGDLGEARKQLLLAMKLYGDPFPLSKAMVKLRGVGASINLTMVSVVPKLYHQTHRGMIGYFFDDIAATLNRLYRLFIDTKENAYAHLAAKLSLIYALKRGCNFRTLCISYGNLISTYQLRNQFSKCVKYEKRALEICRRKRGSLDVTEVQAVCYLYTNIFLFYVEQGKKVESLEFGLSVLHMMTNLIDLTTRQTLVLWMLKLLLSDLRIQDMVSIMREFFYMTDYYDLSSETWYYVYAMVIILDTGYSVETYGTCERFYIKKGDAILRSRTPEAAWYFFVSMWLMTVRVGAWEKSIIWEDKINKLTGKTFEKHDFNIMILARLVEGLLIMLVNEMDNRNVKKIIILEKSVKAMFKEMSKACEHANMNRPRYYFLKAYFLYIRGKKTRAFNFMKKARDSAKSFARGPLLIWAEHTLNHWHGTINPKYIDYWVQHAEEDNLLDYNDFDFEKGRIIPYTLPLPKDLDKN